MSGFHWKANKCYLNGYTLYFTLKNYSRFPGVGVGIFEEIETNQTNQSSFSTYMFSPEKDLGRQPYARKVYFR